MAESKDLAKGLRITEGASENPKGSSAATRVVAKKYIADPIYGPIMIPGRLMQVVDTPEYQATRRLKQMGAVPFVFPSAQNTRFEHGLGVCHLIGIVLKKINEQQPELLISSTFIETSQLAGLCHDIGHGPYSHLSDHNILNKLGLPVGMQNHEERSCALLRYMHSKYKFGFSDSQIDLACNMIMGTPTAIHPRWWFLILANKDTDFDYDKIDYIQRDGWSTSGIKTDLYVDRITTHMRVVGDQIVFHEKVAELVVNVYRQRARMHREVYRHRVVIAFDHLITRILRDVAEVMDWKKMFSDTVTHSWRELTDDVIHRVPELARLHPEKMANALLLYNRMLTRQHPRSKIIHGDKKSANVVPVTIGFTSRANDNPLERIRCFSSFDDITKLRPLLECEVSGINPTKPSEQLAVLLDLS